MSVPEYQAKCGFQAMSVDIIGGQCCYSYLVAVGRPLVVDGQVVTARPLRGKNEAWSNHALPILAGLSLEDRRALADAWTRDALMEHASVASFAKFSLELMAVGAPPALIELAHRAALDEVDHARRSFALASAYLGEPLSPAAMPETRNLVLASDLPSVVRAVFAEGCVNETIAALAAAEQYAGATDPAVRAILAVIAEDEADHAELAWRTVRWALSVGGETVRQALRDALEETVRTARVVVPSIHPDTETSRAHGRISAMNLSAIRRSAIHDLVVPVVTELLATA